MLKNKQGMAMLIVISLILMLLILGGAVLMISTGHFGTSYHQMKRARAYYAAEAAMQHALWALRTGQAVPGDDIDFPAGGINGIPTDDISINVALNVNPAETPPKGVYPITITVDY